MSSSSSDSLRSATKTRNTKLNVSLCLRDSWLILRARSRSSAAASAQSRTSTHVETLASAAARRPARGLERRKARQRLHRRASCRRSARSRCPGQRDYRLPFEFTAGTHDGGSSADRSAEGQRVRDAGRRPRALVLRQRRGLGRQSCSPATASSCPRRQDFGYDSYATLDVKDKVVLVLRYFPEDADHEDASAILARYADLRYKAHGRASARRQGDARRHRTHVAERRRDDPDDASTRRSPDRASSPRASAARSPRRSSHVNPGQDPRGGRSSRSTRATRTSPVSRFPIRRSPSARRSSAKSDGPQRRRRICRRRRRSARRPSRGWRSALTTIIWATARPAIRWRAKTRPAGCISARTTTRRERRRSWRRRDARRASRASATSCSASGRARSSA